MEVKICDILHEVQGAIGCSGIIKCEQQAELLDRWVKDIFIFNQVIKEGVWERTVGEGWSQVAFAR
jgi:hypothetical protein